MITKMRPRYYCEHCSKSTGTAASMRKHEAGCTVNPGRVCQMCKLAGFDQKAVADLVYTLEHEGFAALRAACSRCPACTLAAIRGQRDYSRKDTMADEIAYRNWDYKEDKRVFWREHDDRIHEERGY